MEIRSIPVISTAHMPGQDCWDPLRPTIVVEDVEYGHLVYVRPIKTCDYGSLVCAELLEWLLTIAKWADTHGVDWVWFDCDAATVPELPTYEW